MPRTAHFNCIPYINFGHFSHWQRLRPILECGNVWIGRRVPHWSAHRNDGRFQFYRPILSSHFIAFDNDSRTFDCISTFRSRLSNEVPHTFISFITILMGFPAFFIQNATNATSSVFWCSKRFCYFKSVRTFPLLFRLFSCLGCIITCTHFIW